MRIDRVNMIYLIYDDRIYLSILNIRSYLNMGNVTFSLCPCSRENLMIDHHFFWYPIFRLTHMNFRGFASGLWRPFKQRDSTQRQSTLAAWPIGFNTIPNTPRRQAQRRSTHSVQLIRRVLNNFRGNDMEHAKSFTHYYNYF